MKPQRPLVEHGSGPRLSLQRDLVTHGPQCWKWGQHHYECAKRKVEELEEVVAEQKQTILRNYRHQGLIV